MSELYPTIKVCADCKQEKPLDQFKVYKGRPFSYCIDCTRARDKERSRPYELPSPRYNPRNKPKPAPTQEGYRYCNVCEQEKPFKAFHFRNGKPIASCIECERARDRERNHLRRTRKTPILPEATKPGHKVCNTCVKEKPYNDFMHDTAQKDGYAGRCKQCKRDLYHASRKSKDAKKAYNDAYREANLEALHAYDRQRYKTPQRQSTHLNQLKKRQALIHGLYAEDVDYQRILERDGYWCYICQKPILPRQKFAFDHEIPLLPRKGEPQGFHTEDNIRMAHELCNKRKSNRQFKDLTAYDRRGVN